MNISKILPLLGVIPDSDIAKKFNINVGRIYRLRTKLGIAKSGKRAINIDKTVFDNINHISAYWLGYMFADGNVAAVKDGRYLVSLTSINKDQIQKFSTFIKRNNEKNKIYERHLDNGNTAYTVQVNNKYLFDALEALGCVRNKTSVLDWPDIGNTYAFSFLCGYFDGDGCITYKSYIKSWRITIGIDSPFFMKAFSSFLHKNNILHSVYKRKNKKRFSVLEMSGFAGAVFLKECYKNLPADLPLKYKRVRFELMTSKPLQPPNYQKWEEYIVRDLSLTDSEAADIINNDARSRGWNRKTRNIQAFRYRLAKEG